MILKQILMRKQDQLERISLHAARYHERISPEYTRRNFRQALTGTGISIIAEIKQRSPSAGTICTDFNPATLARAYTAGGAAAISVLTEESAFQGAPEHLIEARLHTSLPVLRKDFIIDEAQIYEAAQLGADAVLLITAITGPEKLRRFIRFADVLGLDSLVEVHSENELDIALQAGASIIGINNRNLDSLKVTLDTSFRLIRIIPKGIITVSESGIRQRHDVLALQQAGFDALLIGETVMRAPDPARKLQELLGAAP